MAESPELTTHNVVKLTVTSNGSSLDETQQIVSVTIHRAVNRIPTAQIVLLDGDMPDQDFPVSNSETFKPGAKIEIKAGYGDSEDTLFKGIVVKHSIKITGNNYARLVVECKDPVMAMAIGRNNANYVDVKDSDVLTQLIKNYPGLTADVEATNTQYPELVQYYCTDWDFLVSRSEVNGCLVIVDNGTVEVKPPATDQSAVLTVTYGQDLMEFHGDLDARDQFAKVQGFAWDLSTQSVQEGEAVGPVSLNKQGDLDAKQLAAVAGLDTFRLQTPVPLDRSTLKDWAKAQQVKAGLSRLRGRMRFQGSAKAKPGVLIQLRGVGNRFNGDVFVTAVEHEISNGNWITEAGFGLSSDWFADRRDLAAPPAAGRLPGIEGLHIGVVKRIDEDPNTQYQVQVTVPVSQAQTEGIWARLANFYASAGIGAFFMPEVGDEVVLGYLNHDPSHPVILGSLYSSARTPPYDPSAENSTKAIVTKSQLKLEFDDEKRVITLITPGNNSVVLSDDALSIVIKDQNENTITLDQQGISLDSPTDISIAAKGNVTINATGGITLNSQADVSVTGLNVNHTANAGFSAKGTASAELSASGQTTVKGAMVMIN